MNTGVLTAVLFIISFVLFYAIIKVVDNLITEIENQTISKAEIEATNRIRVIEKRYEEEVRELETAISIKSEYLRNIREAINNEQRQDYPWLAELYADAEFIHTVNESASKYYYKRKTYKYNDKKILEKKQLLARCKQAEYQLNFYEKIFPWLEDFREIPPKEAFKYASTSDSEYESIKKLLSPEEYKNLSSVEKNRLALDRWRKRKKSNWEVGIEYERYIGYLKEKEGYRVRYNGAIKGLGDMGRDLIAHKGNEIEIIQCKRWSKDKVIREKHIFQLYGTMVVEKLENPEKNVTGIFIMTSELSDVASRCADFLNIKVKKVPMSEDYPLIKCNISQQTGEKIYHLPFDQQYDKVVIDPHRGELYVFTVEEAEALGFRRARPWSGGKS